MAVVNVSNPTGFAAFSGQVVTATSSTLAIRAIGGSLTQTFSGSGFTYAGNSVTGGTVNSISLTDGGITYYVISGLNASAVTVASYVTSGDSFGLSNFLLSGADTINNNSGSPATMLGYGGNDTLNGGAAGETLDGGTGADLMRGGAGDDTYNVDEAGDTVDETNGSGVDTVNSSLSFALGNGVENLFLTGPGATAGTGNGLNNFIVGSAVDNALDGAGGNDTLDGGAGLDTLTGGSGDDTYFIDRTDDQVVESASAGNDHVFASVSFTLPTDVEELQLLEGMAIDGTGNLLANHLTGNAQANLLDGGAGADTLDGGAGDDTYVVDDAGDVLIDSAGNDTVRTAAFAYALAAGFENLTLLGAAASGTGNAADNRLTGNALDNTLTGNGGNDTLDGGGGADTLTGGAGNDTYVIDTPADVINDTGGVDTIATSIEAYLLGAAFENLTLLGAAASGTGNGGNNILTGNSGDNLLDGGAGNDTLRGGAGDDVFLFDSTADLAEENAGEGRDEIRIATSFSLAAFGDIENLTLTGAGNLDGTGNGAANRIRGNEGNNALDGGAGADTLQGGLGDDTYLADNSGDLVEDVANGGYDTVISTATSLTIGAYIEALVMAAGAGNGTGNDIANIITGNAGNNILDGGAGADTLTGGGGGDIFIVDNIGDVVSQSSGGGGEVRSSVTFTLLANIKSLTLTGTGAVNGTGTTAGNEMIVGNDAANVLNGGGGFNDDLYGMGGDDTFVLDVDHARMYGGMGNDTYILHSQITSVLENAGQGTDQVLAYFDYTLTENVEDLTVVFGYAGTGNALANHITGNAIGNSLDGGAGADTLTGGAGGDQYYVDDPNDVVVELAGEGTDTIYVRQPYVSVGTSVPGPLIVIPGFGTIPGAPVWVPGSFTGLSYSIAGLEVENLTLLTATNTYQAGIPDANATGNALANRIFGTAGVNVLDGGAGADTMDAGGGDDIYYVDNAGDVLQEAFVGGIDTVVASISYTLTGYLEHLTLSGSAGISGSGNAYANRVIGNAGANVLSGGAGADTIDGGGGTDTLRGGSGADLYVVDDSGDMVVENGSVVPVARVSVNAQGAQADSGGAAVANATFGAGRYVAFTSGGNIAPDATPGRADVFVKDMQTGTVQRISTAADGGAANQQSLNPLFSADGHLVVFESRATNMIANDPSTRYGIFARDLQTGVLQRVSTTSADGAINDDSYNAAVSADGRYVVFETGASNMIPGDTNFTVDIFRKDLQTRAIQRVSEDALGVNPFALTASTRADISADGRYVVFQCTGQLLLEDSNGTTDIYLKDMQTGALSRVSMNAAGGEAHGASTRAVITDDNRYVLFESAATDLVSGDTNGRIDLFLKDLQTGAIARVSTDSNGNQANGDSGSAAISADGRYIVFQSSADNLADDAGALLDSIYAKDLSSGAVIRVSVGPGGEVPQNSSFGASFSGDGHYIVFTSHAANLVSGDTNSAVDVFRVANPFLEFTGGDIDAVQSNASHVLAANVENLALTGAATISGTGNALNNAITGNSAANSLEGGAGNDTLDGVDGNDSLDGGDSNDSLVGGLGFDTLIGGIGDDTLRGGDQADSMVAGDGNDFLSGGKGLDTLDGGEGNDTLAGLIGNDSLIGGNGTDTADYSASSDAVTVNLATGTGGSTIPVIGTGAGADVLAGIENLLGSLFDDSLTGDLGANAFTGNAGNDTMLASDGFDTLEGGDGNDSLSGMNQGDVIIGGNGNDWLGGGKGQDSIDGGADNDTLLGGLGGDTLTGGSGVDTFVFTTAPDGTINVDTISDFVSGTDLIQLSATIFGAFAGLAGQTVGLASLSGNLAYNASTGALSYDADGAGSGPALNFAILGTSVHPAAIGNDFMIIA